MRYNQAYLEGLRPIGDPAADSLIAELAANGDLARVSHVLRQITKNDQPWPHDLPPLLSTWLAHHSTLRTAIDWQRINNGAAFFARYGMAITVVLSTAALVGCYAAQKGVKVLTQTQRLQAEPYRRVTESGHFVMAVLQPNALQANGEGVQIIQKVRLMHAAVRYQIAQAGQWNHSELGVPICQEDMLGTLMVFSYGVIWGLEQLGYRIAKQQAEDFLYTWNLIGSLIGIDPASLPCSIAEAEDLAYSISKRQHGPSDEGRELTQALLAMHTGLLPGRFFDGMVPALIQHLAGAEVAEWMGVPQTRWKYALRYLKTLNSAMRTITQRLPGLDEQFDRLTFLLLQRWTGAIHRGELSATLNERSA
ncbi:oxygenase MpaB family protein [Herpetosiphon geysericola]|uniref:ER-bound oxygenase mpaB/mpaB'/Rubber oxygenase catalytic domain-containing protein n=1 Tax=Herpetosiphon geysericola TaxID=70996 RepID=A0A0P6XC05_9CHLR|nr:oxygenase MpaB family protein [Herpetosiphon geysericola]KPL80337.1 hypothetical protein SE18_25195 [Herpetosiphon geysericola]